MFHRVLFGCLFLLSVIASVDAEPVTGSWKTNHGPIEMTAKEGGFTGTYAYKDLPASLAGKITEDGSYRVIWVQEISEVECLEVRQGSPYWGRARFVFKGDTFRAIWNYCNRRLRNKRDFRWNGRLSGL